MTAKAEIATNQLITCYSQEGYAYVFLEPKKISLSDIYAGKLESGGTTTVKNRLIGPQARVDWLWKTDRGGYDIIQQWNNGGRNAVFNSIGDSTGDMVTSYLPTDEWKESTAGTPWNFIVYLFDGSFGNNVQGRESAVSPVVSYATEEMSWREFMNEGRAWGYKLIRKKPYVYAQAAFGRQAKGQRIMVIGARCYTDALSTRNIGLMNIEPNAILFIGEYCEIHGGILFHPTQMDKDGYKPTWSVGIASRVSPMDISLGYQSSENEQKAILGFAFTF
jgi:hypothetical protein